MNRHDIERVRRRAAELKTEKPAPAHPKRNRKVPPRLPHKAHFDFDYDAIEEKWVGRLTVDGITVHAKGRAVFTVFETLDRYYRNAAAEVVKKMASG